MATTTSITVSINSVTKGFAKGMGRAASTTANFAKTVAAGTAKLGAFGAAISAVVGGAGLAVLVKQSFDTIDALAKTSDKLGIATERLAGLRHAAELTGAGSKTLDMALQRMTRRISEAAQGGGEAVKALQELGLNAKSLAASAPDEAFRQIADAMSRVEGQSNKVRLAFKLFDSEGVSLVNTLAAGRQGLDEMQAEAEKLGIAINRVDAAKIEMANDAITKMRSAFQGVVNQLAIKLAPAVTVVAEKFANWIAEVDFAGIIGESSLIVTVLGRIADRLQLLKGAWHALAGGVQFAVGLMLKPLNWLISGMSSLVEMTTGYRSSSAVFFDELTEGLINASDKSFAKAHESFTGEWASKGIERAFADIQRQAEKIGKAAGENMAHGINDKLAGNLRLPLPKARENFGSTMTEAKSSKPFELPRLAEAGSRAEFELRRQNSLERINQKILEQEQRQAAILAEMRDHQRRPQQDIEFAL